MLCFMLCFLLSVRHIFAKQTRVGSHDWKWIYGHNTVSMEVSLHFCQEHCALFVFVHVYVFVLVISMQVVHMLRTFQVFVSLVLSMKDAVVKGTTHLHTSVFICFQHMECLLFDILLYLLLLLKRKKQKCHNLWTCICIWALGHNVLCFRLIHRVLGCFHTWRSCSRTSGHYVQLGSFGHVWTHAKQRSPGKGGVSLVSSKPWSGLIAVRRHLTQQLG